MMLLSNEYQRDQALGFLIITDAKGYTIQYGQAQAGTGTPFLWGAVGGVTWGYLSTRDPQAHNHQALTQQWIADLFERPTTLGDLPGIFGFWAANRPLNRIIVACDRLGIESIYYVKTGTRSWAISSHLMWLLMATGHDGAVNEEGFFAHMGFGYTVSADQELYQGVHKLPPGGYLDLQNNQLKVGTYWQAPEPVEELADDDIPLLAIHLQQAVETRLVDQVFIGTSAGKDSLCIASTLTKIPDLSILSGTFGQPGCADQLQGKAISEALGWAHASATVCAAADFAQRVRHIAFHSAGMSTASYVDFVNFIDTCIPPGTAYVMGEGGECVRDFFQMEGGSFVDKLIQVYTTPGDYLRQTLAPRFTHLLDDYPANIVRQAQTVAQQPDDDAFTVYFYRFQRMFGNFGPRHQIFSALRPRLCPFLDARFINRAFRLAPKFYTGSDLHRAIIEATYPAFLPFFSHPVISNQHVQDWPARFANGELGTVLMELFDATLPTGDDILDRDGVLKLCAANITHPSRAIYHLLRMITFTTGRHLLRAERPQYLKEIRPVSIL